ncbi:MAG: CHAD domain-containing protein [Cyanobacteria bacterium RM1_2_2]|nr:CHAD domain-containing protein [Cyanobacteria bacterium RM1_2_2]
MTKTAGQASQKASTKQKDKTEKLDEQQKSKKVKSAPVLETFTLGDYAHTVIAKQYQRLVKQESGVLQDSDPEYLHQMRVGTRRLRTALQVFGEAVKLPKPARENQVRALTKVLGQLRDLDVQIAALGNEYRPQLPPSEQEMIDRASGSLHKQRVKIFAEVKSALSQVDYQHLKAAYEKWIAAPEFSALAQLPLEVALPDILSPLLSKLLLHPGWLVAAADQSTRSGVMLHELRKVCKQARYQAEFFTDFYGDSFQNWVNELRQLQEDLGIVQDTHVLSSILANHLPAKANFKNLQQVMQQQQTDALTGWDELRSKYLDAAFRRQLYEMILQPKSLQPQ